MIFPRQHPLGSRETTLSLPSIVAVALPCALTFICGIGVFILWLLRRRAAHRPRALHEDGVISVEQGDSPAKASKTRSTLQRLCSVAIRSVPKPQSKDDDNVLPLRHRSFPAFPSVFKGLNRRQSCKWPSRDRDMSIKTCREKPSWIDEDALHGPRVSGFPTSAEGRTRARGSWPLVNQAPTLPRLHYSVYGYPTAEWPGEEAIWEGFKTGLGHGQVHAGTRELPEPPRPALPANRGRHDISRISKPRPSPAGSPTRAPPKTPSRSSARPRSTDSSLREILRSTEKRLREGTVCGTARSIGLTESPSAISKLRHSKVSVPSSRTPSPRKTGPGNRGTPGHRIRSSGNPVPSVTGSLVGGECGIPDGPSVPTSPSGNQRKQGEAEQHTSQIRSVRSSVSSELSTLYSEDEMPEEVRRAIMPLAGLVVQSQQAANVLGMNDPFVSAPSQSPACRASINQGWPAKQHKAQDLFRQSLERSRYLRRMTLGHPPAQPVQELVLAPRPLTLTAKPTINAIDQGSSRRCSMTEPGSIQPCIGSYAPSSKTDEPPPIRDTQTFSPHNNLNGQASPHATKISTPSATPALPQPTATDYLSILREQRRKTISLVKPEMRMADDQRSKGRSTTLIPPSVDGLSFPSRSGSENRRAPLVFPLNQHQQQGQQHQLNQNRQSISSSVYSQDLPNNPSNPVADLEHAGFHENSLPFPSPYPAPLSVREARANSSSSSSSSKTLAVATRDSVPTATPTILTVIGEEDSHKDKPDGDCNGKAKNECQNQDQNGSNTTNKNKTLAVPVPVLSTIASLRRMNSSISTCSSTATATTAATLISSQRSASSTSDSSSNSISSEAGKFPISIPIQPQLPPPPLPQRSDQRETTTATTITTTATRSNSTIGAKNYFALGSGGGGGGVAGVSPGTAKQNNNKRNSIPTTPRPASWVGTGGIATSTSPVSPESSPLKRRRAVGGVMHPIPNQQRHHHPHQHHHRRPASAVLTRAGPLASSSAGPELGYFRASADGEGKENSTGLSTSDKNEGAADKFKPVTGEFTFEAGCGGGDDGKGIKTEDWGESPSKRSLKSVDSLGLYDRDGFLIASSPVRVASPGSRV